MSITAIACCCWRASRRRVETTRRYAVFGRLEALHRRGCEARVRSKGSQTGLMQMDLNSAFDDSERLVAELLQIIDLPTIDSQRVRISDTACSLSLEHWHSVLALLAMAMLPSALVIHRAQFEAVVRSVWLTYAAHEEDLDKLTATLNLESEQAAKNMPTVNEMMQRLQKVARAAPAYAALDRFKQHSWKALNSYTHAGIHPLRRHAEGYPIALIHSVLCNTNGLGVMACMQAVVLSDEQPLQRQILDIAAKYPGCMPPLL